jgi:hypothetical protein
MAVQERAAVERRAEISDRMGGVWEKQRRGDFMRVAGLRHIGNGDGFTCL